MNKQEILKELKDMNAKIQYDKKWRYPHSGDNQLTCPLLAFMFQVEYRSGYLIFIPDEKNTGNEGNRNEN